MSTHSGPDAFADDATLTAVALVKARAAAGQALAAVEEQAATLDRFVERFGIHGCRALVAALTDLVVSQAQDSTALLTRLEELELTTLIEAERREG